MIRGFALDPTARTRKPFGERVNGEAVLNRCVTRLRAARADHETFAAKARAEGVAGLKKWYREAHLAGKKRLKQARKLSKKRDPFSILDANGHDSGIIKMMGRIRDYTRELFPKDKSFASLKVSPTMTAQQMLDDALKIRERVKAEQQKLHPRVDRADKQWKKLFMRSLRGARKRVVKKNGMPWFEGWNLVSSKKRLRAAKTSPTYRYYVGNRCTEYRFRGTRLTRTARCK